MIPYDSQLDKLENRLMYIVYHKARPSRTINEDTKKKKGGRVNGMMERSGASVRRQVESGVGSKDDV